MPDRTVIDLDSAAKERRAKPRSVKFKGQEWALPASPPWAFITVFRRVQRDGIDNVDESLIDEMMSILLTPDVWQRWTDELQVDIFDVMTLLDGLMDLYSDQIDSDDEGEAATAASKSG